MPRYEGLDLSHFEPKVDWSLVKASGRSFAMAKATEGTVYIDPTFVRHRFGARAVGLPFGAYHFGHPGEDAAKQAERFFEMVGPLVPGELIPWLDLEQHGQATAAEVLTWTRSFLSRCDELFGKMCGLYTGYSFWRDFMGDPTAQDLAMRPLWVARYGSNAPEAFKIGPAWIWQYAAGNEGKYVDPVPGAGLVDKNVCLVELDRIRVGTA